MNTWFHSFWSLLFPRCCVVCGSPLSRGEECLCTCCNINLPRTGFHLRKDNPVECLFWGRIPGLKRASSFLFYRKGSDFRRILHLLKYGGYKELGEVMGRYMSAELSSGEFFDGVDMIIPVPLHRKKQKLRGYNQSEWIARGIASVTGIPLCAECMIREKNTETQTRKSTFERWENVEGIFKLCDTVHFEGKHVLLVDDVLTTGATTVACASAFARVSGIRISVLTLAVAE
ncbi:ComF family protein [Bacteroides fragilis]|uniref:ComF family protein n=1 Tax=Bacteroides TaxID=816 RepID=UPI001F3A6C48|nr:MULTISPECIES: ComF family protein [Bacteroides]MCE8616930.1 ComF family protein [Bacteroides fragilis]MCF2688524.1 ComF family protein [Bacteroides fragilis]MCZ2603150.1 ComF family protein [Bacteroides fragilis]MCZ2664102.1 ComF family protein [Bacteroides fragilis]MDV6150982.1 ComF family protein [Bacteroides hominis (ex Liu et al. 2022)]